MTIRTDRGEWRPVTGFDLYEVSPAGEVRNRKRGRLLSPGRSSNGYLLVVLYRNGKRFNRTVHSLVAAAYVAGYFEGAVVRHRNNEMHDNRAENLLWGTQADNEQDKVVSGRHPPKEQDPLPAEPPVRRGQHDPPERGASVSNVQAGVRSSPQRSEGGSVNDGGRHAGQWMQTFTGRVFYPLAAHADDIDPADIAHHLSLLCRYNGAVSRFFSVAEHCVLISYAVSPENALWALLHDATEAYMGDMIRPLKRMMPAYSAAEDRLMAVICDRFGLDPVCPAEVKAADNRILRDERDALMAAPPQPWDSIEGVSPLGVRVEGWAPAEAERRYTERLLTLLSTGGAA